MKSTIVWILFGIAAAVFTHAAEAEPVQWTNTAQNPTKWDFSKGFQQLENIGIPQCMHLEVAQWIRYPRIGSDAIMVTDEKVFTKYSDYETTFLMTYGDKVTAKETRAAQKVVAMGHQRTFTCGSKVMHLSYFEKCDNLGIHAVKHGLEEWKGYSNGGGGSGERTFYAPTSGTLGLLILGLAAIGAIKKWRN